MDGGRIEDGSAARPVGAAEGRIAGASGIDPTVRRRFTWEGRALSGFAGDTLAAALLAGGVRVAGRGFKYHRPRGVTSAGVEEAGAIVGTGGGARKTPNVNAATEELTEGLAAYGQNAWPGVGFDLGRVNDAASPFFGAGFYYKTFFSLKPWGSSGTRDWMLYEKAIRRAAGMGRAAGQPDVDSYETVHAFCGTLVVGSGPAGLAAAETLAAAGEDVILAEQDFALGGRLLADAAGLEGAAPLAWRDARLAALAAAGARVMPRTTVFGLYDHGVAGLVEKRAPNAPASAPRERLWILRAERILLATGAIERGLVFAGNDRPGVMTAGALRAYVGRFGVLPGRRIVVAATNDSAYADLDRLAAAGAEVTVLDARPAAEGRRAAGAAGVAHRPGAAPAATRAGLDGALASVAVVRADGAGWSDIAERFDADLLAVSGGWSPTVHLASQRGMKPVWDEALGVFVAGPRPSHEPPIELAGAAAGIASGIADAEACAVSGRNAALRLLGRPESAPPPSAEGAKPPRRLFAVAAPDARGKAFVDLLHDVAAKDVAQAVREGFVSVEHLKRYTTLGMAPDQGKTSNLAGLALLAEARGLPIGEVGTTTFRPPYTPVSLGALAGARHGRHLEPERRTPMHAWNLRHGAVMTDAGLWKRPWYYPKSAEPLAAAYVREAAAVRTTVGLCDVTSLGKIAVQGAGAAEFLDRVYVNGFAKLPIGRARYGVMLREDGFVYDDGTVWRLGETDYFMTTTTAGAGKVMSWLEKLAETRWSDLDVTLTSVTERWAGFSVAGPLARRLLGRLVSGVDFGDAAFPFMGVRTGAIGETACRIARISFSGELAYEIYVEADHGEALADALWSVAEPWGGVLYGTEALGALRIEKGHVAGAELDGRTTLGDLGLGAMASKTKAYIGSALGARPALNAPDRERLVGLMLEPGETPFSNGAILCAEDAVSGHGLGWIASTTWSPALDRHIGLGLIAGGLAAWGDKIVVAADPARGKQSRVRVVSPHMVDPENHALKPAADPAAPGDAAALRPPPARLARRSALGTEWDRRGETGGRPLCIGRTAPSEAPEARAGDAPVWMIEGAPERIWRLAVWRDSAAGSALAAAAGGRALRVGPLEWLLVGLDAAGAERLAAGVGAAGAALELSHGLARFRIGGARAGDLLNRIAALDLRERAFPVGRAAGTGAHHTALTLHRVAPEAFDVYVMRSFAASVWDELAEAAERMAAAAPGG